MDAQLSKEIAETIQGSLAILSLPSLDPPKLNAIIRAIQRSVPAPQSKPQDKTTDKKVADDDFVPGRRVKRVKPIQTPELSLMGALIDGRVFKAPQVQDVAQLPTLDTLHAQLVGLLSSPGAQLAAVLSQASGGQLARTLQGFQKSLEDAEKTDAGQST
jgi:ribosomal protein L10